MIALSIGVTSVAHGIHYAVVGAGLLGVLMLLGPQLVTGHRGSAVLDEHTRRVRALTEQLAGGGLGVGITPALTSSLPATFDLVRGRYVPLAVVSSAAAAGVHAAVAPAHFAAGTVFGLFFVGAALAQVVWSLAMVTRPSRTLLRAGVAGNAAILVLWLATRTTGLPGLLPTPEAVGVWDLSCGAFEVVVMIAAGRILAAETTPDLRAAPWRDWDPVARSWALGAIALSLVCSLFGLAA